MLDYLQHNLYFSSVDSLGRILSADVVNRGAGYTSIPSVAVADANCLCQMQVGNSIHCSFFSPPQLSCCVQQSADVPGAMDACLKLHIALDGRLVQLLGLN